MSQPPCTLSMIGGRLHARLAGAGEPVAVDPRYLRPLTEPRHVVLLDDEGKEVLLLEGLDGLNPACRELAEAALASRYRMPRIERVEAIDLRFGTLYWTVTTDCGAHRFALIEPGRNVTWLSGDRLIICDSMGNRYEVASLNQMDAHSRELVAAVL